MMKPVSLATFDELCDALDLADAEIATLTSVPRVYFARDLGAWIERRADDSWSVLTESEAKTRLTR